MKEIYYTYNNEAIATCVFLSFLNKTKKVEVDRLCLVLPFLFDNRTIHYLTGNPNISNIEKLIELKPKYFISFNKRYLTLLPVFINSLNILYNTTEISVKDSNILGEGHLFEKGNYGERFEKINKNIPYFINLIKGYSTKELYNILRVRL